MLANAKQSTRHLAVFTPWGENVVLLRRLDGTEGISIPFEFELEMISDFSSLSAGQIVGRNITFSIEDANVNPRYFNGYVRRFAQVSQDGRATTYAATVVPWLWFLTQTKDCRIFQEKSTPEIITQVFTDLGFTDFRLDLSADYLPREYCVQYRESDFDFVCRLMEEEGIYYYFVHENGKHTLICADATSGYFPLPEAHVEFGDPGNSGDLADQITDWQHAFQFHSGRVAHRDFNFESPSQDLLATSPTRTQLPNINVFERYEYPGRYHEGAQGKTFADIRMEAEEAKFDRVAGSSNYRSFAPGGTFRVESHLSSNEVGREFVLLKVTHSASVGGTYLTGTDDSEWNYRNAFVCQPRSVVFRPERRTKRPRVEGIQTAAVAGPAGEEIYTDRYGRVKVQFPWDREGNRDENSSCWMRVSQLHAGKGWGHMDLPRVGEEVVVNFLDGNPDRPIIKGRVYNGKKSPTFFAATAKDAKRREDRHVSGEWLQRNVDG